MPGQRRSAIMGGARGAVTRTYNLPASGVPQRCGTVGNLEVATAVECPTRDEAIVFGTAGPQVCWVGSPQSTRALVPVFSRRRAPAPWWTGALPLAPPARPLSWTREKRSANWVGARHRPAPSPSARGFWRASGLDGLETAGTTAGSIGSPSHGRRSGGRWGTDGSAGFLGDV
ncbi:hypothetical protein SEVIR_2G388633v4 [Setaria viridis]